MLDDRDHQVLRLIYDAFARTGTGPSAEELAHVAGETVAARAALERLEDAHLVVLRRDDDGSTTSEIEMALPFSGVRRPHEVRIGASRWFANCAWDTFGILGALGRDGTITSSCADCHEPLTFSVEGDEVAGEGLVHFVVPAQRWWDDIRFT